MDSPDTEIARLLRLKRYEQPPPGYFDNFLREFRRRRDRDELLREPLWSICLDRLRDFMFRHRICTLAGYSAGIATAAACVAVIAFTMFQKPYTTPLAVRTFPVPNIPRFIAQGFNFAPSVVAPMFNIRPTLVPGSRHAPVVLAHSIYSDKPLPFELVWDEVDDDESPFDE
jgi:hypothetical protein